MAPIHIYQEFPSLKSFKEALNQWAVETHFEPRILKSDTSRVRVGCKRDPNCPFTIRCSWHRRGGREPHARVTVMKDRHTCLDGVVWRLNAAGQQDTMTVQPPSNGEVHGSGQGNETMNTIEIRQDKDGEIVGGARVLGPIDLLGRIYTSEPQMVPVLPKVPRPLASRLSFLMENLPRLMNITQETTLVEMRECLLREYGAEVNLQQCRRAKTEILKKLAGEEEMGQQQQQGPSQPQAHIPEMNALPQQQQNLVGMSERNDAGQQLSGDIRPNDYGDQNQSPFTLRAASGCVTPVMPNRSSAALQATGEAPVATGEAPVRCPYCINLRWMKSIKDAVEHMSMHVTV